MRVWRHVAAGVEVVVEVFLKAGELEWISWLKFEYNDIVMILGPRASAVIMGTLVDVIRESETNL